MSDKSKDEEGKAKEAQDAESGGLGRDETGQKMLYEAITRPSKERMPEQTDLPLNQITPLSWMATFDSVLEEAVQYIKFAIDCRRYKNALRRGDPGAKMPEIPTPVIPSETFREWYYKHRRSLAGAGVKTLAVLAERQLEVQQEATSPDQLAGLTRD